MSTEKSSESAKAGKGSSVSTSARSGDSVTVIMPTFNRLKLMQNAVASVLAQTRRPDFFIVLDNGSVDGSFEVLQALCAQAKATHPGLQFEVIRVERNIGASRAIRFLLEKARALATEWVWVMDDDAEAFPDALEKLLSCPEAKQADTYILETAVLNANSEWAPENRPARFLPKTFEFEGLPADALAQAQGKAIAVDTGGYFGLCIRTCALTEFGFPLEDFYLWYDDVEFVIRVSRKKKVYLVPTAFLKHFGQSIVPQVVRWPFNGAMPDVPYRLAGRYYYLHRNRLWLAKQWLPTKSYARFWVKHVAKNFLSPVLLRQDHKVARMFLALRSGFDALFNRLGERVKTF